MRMATDIDERLATLERELAAAKEAASATTPAAPKPVKKSSRRTKKIILTAIIAAILIASACGATYYLHTRKPESPLANYTATAGFSLYYPSTLPDDYQLDTKDISATSGLLTYTLRSNSKPEITVSVQKAPKGFDASSIIGGASVPSQGIPIGSMYNISAGSQSKYFITTDHDAIIFLSSTQRVANDTLNNLARSLQEVR